MNPTVTLLVVAIWSLLGMARMVFTSRMVELRIDHPDPSQAMALTWKAAQQRINPANDDRRGQRLVPDSGLRVSRCLRHRLPPSNPGCCCQYDRRLVNRSRFGAVALPQNPVPFAT